MFRLLIDFFIKKEERLPKDELIGIWTNEDDGSGLINIFGWSLHFLENGKGKSCFWDRKTEDNSDFEWERVAKGIIKLRSEGEKWEVVRYEIQKYIGAYESKQYKLTEIDENKFWNFHEPLFKRR